MSVFNFIEWRDLYIGIVYPWLCFLLFKSTTCMIAQKWKRNQQQQQNPTAAVAAAATATASNMQKFNKKPDENLFHLTLHLTASSHKRWWKSVLCIIFFALFMYFVAQAKVWKQILTVNLDTIWWAYIYLLLGMQIWWEALKQHVPQIR